MSSKLGSFISIEQQKGLYSATKSNLRCTALKLKSGGILLFSPVANMGEDAASSLKKIGEVQFLLAPNHYHNKALGEYVEHFPNAILCASQSATPRLKKVTGLDFNGLDKLKLQLPNHLSLLEPDGLKTGEVWIRSKTASRQAWLLVDALAGEKMSKNTEYSGQISYLKTFPNYGVNDLVQYLAWLNKQLAQDQPTTIIPCHGAITFAKNLPLQISELMENVFNQTPDKPEQTG
jgi:hypothetical protein